MINCLFLEAKKEKTKCYSNYLPKFGLVSGGLTGDALRGLMAGLESELAKLLKEEQAEKIVTNIFSLALKRY